MTSHEHKIQYEYRGNEISQPAGFAPPAAEKFYDLITDEAKRESIGDRIRKRNANHRQERRDGFRVIFPINCADILTHHRADNHQRRCAATYLAARIAMMVDVRRLRAEISDRDLVVLGRAYSPAIVRGDHKQFLAARFERTSNCSCVIHIYL